MSIATANAANARGYWVHDLSPFLVKFPEGWPLEGIRYYGLAYLLGFVVGGLLLWIYFRKGKSPLNGDRVLDLMTYIVLGVMVGGRLGYMLFYDLYDFLANPLIIFQVHEGGMASHGGFLGVILAAVIFARRNQVSFLKLTDILATITPPGLMFGRIANFINGELWGRPATVPWAVIFPESAPEGMAAVPRHPSQLYQAGLEGLSLLILVQIRFWTSRGRLPAGQLSGEFLIAYACFRIFAELFREPDLGDPMILGMSRGQFLSIFMIAVGAVVIVWARVRSQARV